MLQLDQHNVLLDLQARTKEEVLQEMATALQKQCPQIELENLCSALRERELIGSTGVGNGVAIPHGKVSGLDRIIYGFGRSRDGVPFDAIDNQPAHYFFMILSPVNAAEQYLKTLASASRMLKQQAILRSLRLAKDQKEVIDIFHRTAEVPPGSEKK